MIEGKFLYGADDDLSDIFEIRRSVFVDEEGISEETEFDGLDHVCLHGIIKVEGKKLGAGRILYDGDTFWIGHIAILKEERGKKYGDFLVRMLLDRCFNSGAQVVLAQTKPGTERFFEKIGFCKCSDVYEAAGGILQVDLRLTKDSLCKECDKK